jgi:hypothetical protein
MLPCCRSKGISGFVGVRMRPSDPFATDISQDCVRWWLGTFDSANLVARAYDMAAWCFAGSGHPRLDINFADVQSLANAEFLALPMHYVDCEVWRNQRHAARQQQ